MGSSDIIVTTSQGSNLIKVTQLMEANKKSWSQIFLLQIQSCFYYIKLTIQTKECENFDPTFGSATISVAWEDPL